MAVPKRKTSPSRRNMRRSHDFLRPVQQVVCSNCSGFHLPHHLCATCGFYKGRSVRSPHVREEA